MTNKDAKMESEDIQKASADKLKLDASELDEVSGGKYAEYYSDPYQSDPDMKSHSKKARGRLSSWTGNQNNIR